ncbi:MAG: tRNA (adenosine(37)-N6)-threonylcarbamoyltransferase complex transferase subunit TsaD [Candidatus Colwellbacteria bacterium]|nr:tRNA (adenosine(37)-N6)-threonylcarbamoyltransferase complex transferase subunit TsaD [Candidatus Colwellbacteria bacterium]
MKILGIETSCDETALAIVEARGRKNPGFKILKNIVSSQIKTHRPYGGVVPNLAKREHLKNLPIVLKKIKPDWKEIDLIAVTNGPGLEPALWTGINFAKSLAEKYKKPLMGVNHLEGHLYSPLIELKSNANIYPAIGLIISGGHTIIVVQKSLTSWEKIGETRDDAVGEAYDKVARLLGLPYPGGPEIERLALQGNPNAINFPRPMLNTKSDDFSFSGLKTAVLYYLRDNPKFKKADVAASFEEATIDVFLKKTIKAALEYKAKSIYLGGGVAANKTLRKALKKESDKWRIKFITPSIKLSTDNAAMIAEASYINFISKKGAPQGSEIQADAHLNL